LRKFGIIQRRVANLKIRVIHGCCPFMSGGEYGYSDRQAFPETRDLREHRDAHLRAQHGKLNSISECYTVPVTVRDCTSYSVDSHSRVALP